MISELLLALFFVSPIIPSIGLTGVFMKPLQNTQADTGPTYDELHDEALFNCPYAKRYSTEKENIIVQFVTIEKSFSPPANVRGMLLAAACMESGFNPRVKGDKKYSKNKKKPMAAGILQLWPIYEKIFPGLDRTDPKSAAKAWMVHIVKQIPKVKRICHFRTDARTWLAAWVAGMRYKKNNSYCNENPPHYRLLKRWHRNIKRNRRIIGCAGQDGCDG